MIYSGFTLRISILIVLVMLLNVDCYDQSVRDPLAAGYTGMGAYSQNFIDPFSVSSNQAALAGIKSVRAGIYGEKRFLIEELSFYKVAACLPVSFGGMGISAKYFGYNEYNETQLGIAYGKSLGKVDLGVEINFHGLQIAGYGKDELVTFEAGLVLHISEQVIAGVHVFNPTSNKFGNNHLEKISSGVSVGCGYEVSENLLVSGEVIKEEDQPVTVNAGVQYAFAGKLFARVGIYTETTSTYFGVGLKWENFRIDITGSFHPQLGFTPGFMLLFEANQPKE